MSEATPVKQKYNEVKPVHPPFKEMTVSAVQALNERNGSSRQAIIKYITTNYEVGDNASSQGKACILRLVANGTLTRAKGSGASGSFRLTNKQQSAKKPAAKKPAAKKTGSKETGSKENVSKENVSKENVSKENGSKENVSKENVSKENVSKENGSKENGSKESCTKEINSFATTKRLSL